MEHVPVFPSTNTTTRPLARLICLPNNWKNKKETLVLVLSSYSNCTYVPFLVLLQSCVTTTCLTYWFHVKLFNNCLHYSQASLLPCPLKLNPRRLQKIVSRRRLNSFSIKDYPIFLFMNYKDNLFMRNGVSKCLPIYFFNTCYPA